MLKKIITDLSLLCIIVMSIIVPSLAVDVKDELSLDQEFFIPQPTGRIGDINGDNKVNSTDLTLLRRYILEIISDFEVEDNLWSADLNGDNLINSTDYALLKRYIIESITEFPKETRNDYIQVECGQFHTIALKYDGTVWTWGDNNYGKLGIGEGLNKTEPANVNSLEKVVVVSAGKDHSMALKEDGTVWTWGRNNNGQLGDGTNISKNRPVMVKGLTGVKDIRAGSDFSVALKTDGTVWIWGNNSNGQLGDGTTINRSTPIEVNGLNGVEMIAAGQDHVLILKDDKTVWAWGASLFGQVGNGTLELNTLEPVKVNGLLDIKFITAGEKVSAAIKEDGSLWLWGNNNSEIMGKNYSAFLIYDTPKKYEGIDNIRTVSLAGEHVAALKNDGTVWSWGQNFNGVLGDGTTENNNTPTKVEGLDLVKYISVGENHVAVLKYDGSSWSWGSNKYGQLGNGEGNFSNTPIHILDVSRITKVVSGLRHVVALDEDGSLWAWGNNENYQLIENNPVNQINKIANVPFKITREAEVNNIVAGPTRTVLERKDGTIMMYATSIVANNLLSPSEIGFFKGFKKIAVGDKHIVAIGDDKKVYSSGDSYWGQLGNGSQNHHNNFGDNFVSSVEATGLSDIIDISTGKDHSVALKEDGTVWAWGYNLNGELGNGRPNNISLVPVKVEDIENVISISSGMAHVLALKEDGTVWAWGKNSQGQLGNNSTTRSRVPVQVEGLENVVVIEAGRDHSIAMKEDGTVWGWGDNSFGQLGDGTNENRLIPVEIEQLKGVKAISAGGDFTIAIKEDGSLLSMGNNHNGALGIGEIDKVLNPVKAK
ncbi:UNVERIFIED_CONTAM: alpha-tubulin suppressor-like RCC1 family protein [Acetivibrio alkalicellulosi]